eukprot:scaffold22292_cov62-Phaeocystis_antarctica.AAC.2
MVWGEAPAPAGQQQRQCQRQGYGQGRARLGPRLRSGPTTRTVASRAADQAWQLRESVRQCLVGSSAWRIGGGGKEVIGGRDTRAAR